jgi:hypothetical protein
MIVSFELDPKDWISLLTLSAGLPGYEALKAATPTRQTPIIMTVCCDLAEAVVLLDIAKKHRPYIAPIIAQAIKGVIS